ncbi:MAG: VCBS repeat-containing protein [Myxococcales bacterium]|nr:VCBS repeat-containing protein [Myxococcales bacterium]
MGLQLESPPFKSTGRDAPAIFGTGEAIDPLARAGIDFLSIPAGSWGAFDWDGWVRAHFEALARRGVPLKLVLVIGGTASACAPTSLQLAADRVWKQYANGAFARGYQHFEARPLLLLDCSADTRWNDDNQDRFTIRISPETPPTGARPALRNELKRWRSAASPRGELNEAVEQLEVSLDEAPDWHAVLDLDPAVLTLRGRPAEVEAISGVISAFKANRSELIIRETGTGTWHFRSAPTFSAETLMTWAPGRHYQPTACDFDGDGFTDVALRDSNPAGAGRWHFRRGPRLRGEDEWALAWPQRSGPEYDALAADFDGDGLCEVAVRHRQSGVVSWRGAFDGAEEQSHNFPTGESALVGDFNRDGQLDLAINQSHSSNSRAFTVFLGPRFGPEDSGQLLWADGATSLGVAGDFDGDDRTEFGLLEPSGTFCVRAMGQPASVEACSPAAFSPGVQVLSANVR